MFISLLICTTDFAQQEQKSTLQQQAETEEGRKNIAGARSLYLQAYKEYIDKRQNQAGVECGVKAAALYQKENLYKEAFDLLHGIDNSIDATVKKSSKEKAALHYLTTRERFQMYMKMHKSSSAADQLTIMDKHARLSGKEELNNDLLYNKTIYYYTLGQNEKGNATFKVMAKELTAKKDYDKVDEVYQTLIENGRRSNSASLVAQSYKSYIAWKDSVAAIKRADEIGALNQQIADNEATIAEKDSSLATHKMIIVGLGILAATLAIVLVIGAVVLLRFIVLTRKQKSTISSQQENIALKAKFISNISAQLDPTLKKLDSKLPEVKALQDFSAHIQTLSQIESSPNEAIELEELQIAPFCESLMDTIRDKVKSDVVLTVNAPKMSACINKDYVSHILTHLLTNAAHYTHEGGHITLDFKKRGVHKYQFLVSNTGERIPEEKRENVFKPFVEIHDLTTGDGLGLPICWQMAQKMNGELSIDPEFTKGTRFVLNLHE